jgi:sensor histidine kinase YesM
MIQWLRFAINNLSVTDTIRLNLHIGAHYFARLYDNNGMLAKIGIYETSAKGYNKATFQITLKPNSSNVFWVRTEDRQGMITPAWISLETDSTLSAMTLAGVRRDRLLFLFLAMLTGCLFFISIFAFYQYLLYKDKAFLWYVAYTMTAAFVGLFWIDIRLFFGLFSSFFHDLIFSVFLFIVPVLYSFFIGKMLKLPDQFKKGWLIVKILMIVAILQMLIEFTTIRTGRFMFTDYYGYFVSMIPVALLNIVLLVLTAMSREKVKWFMFGGLLSMLLLWCMPLIVFPAIDFRMAPITMVLIFIPFYFLFGLTIEAVIFSFALSYRSKIVLIEKNNLEKQYSLQLQEELSKRTSELEEKNKLVEKQKLLQIQTAFDQKIAETEMIALRSQMNPHFIFNCLNSIKLYTLENDSAAASEYLTVFSQLIRLVLENSHSEKVSLQKELETLRLYIELEAMRFKDKVQYKIEVAPEIDQQYTEIPPLLIQPYVENAIWHGLMHKKNGGIINIAVTQSTEQSLLIEISDNGVGRQVAAAYKSKSATRQKSFGMKMTSERISIINQIYKMEADIQINDIKDDFDNTAGTKVSIKIPV